MRENRLLNKLCGCYINLAKNGTIKYGRLLKLKTKNIFVYTVYF